MKEKDKCTRNVSMRVTESMYKHLKSNAAKSGLNVSQLCKCIFENIEIKEQRSYFDSESLSNLKKLAVY